jgi:hypothetical protein
MIAPIPDKATVKKALGRVAENGTPDPAFVSLFDVGTGQYLDHFDKEVLSELVSGGGATCRFFEGAYGAGKSHLLLLLRERCLQQGMAVVQTNLSSAMKLEEWDAITKHVLDKITVRVSGEEVTGIPRVLEALRDSGRPNVAALREQRQPHPGFKEGFLRVVDGAVLTKDGKEALFRFLRGDRVSATELRQKGVTGVKQPLTARNAEQVLATLLGSLYQLGLPGTALLFDEAERSFPRVMNREIPPKRIRVGANLMRRLIDACTTDTLPGTFVAFTVLPDFLSNCALAYPALGQRLQIRRFSEFTPGWRSPVIALPAVNEASSPEDFGSEVVMRFEQIVRAHGSNPAAFTTKARMSVRDVLQEHASDGYRRPLMKRLADLTLTHL